MSLPFFFFLDLFPFPSSVLLPFQLVRISPVFRLRHLGGTKKGGRFPILNRNEMPWHWYSECEGIRFWGESVKLIAELSNTEEVEECIEKNLKLVSGNRPPNKRN